MPEPYTVASESVVKAYLQHQKGRLKPRTFKVYQETFGLYQEFIQSSPGIESALSQVPPFLESVDQQLWHDIEFRKGAGTALKKFAGYLAKAGLTERTQAREISKLVNDRNRKLRDPFGMFVGILEEWTTRPVYPIGEPVSGKFMRATVGRYEILFEELESDATKEMKPFWLEVGEEGCQLCELTCYDHDLILAGSVVNCGPNWQLVKFEGVEVF